MPALFWSALVIGLETLGLVRVSIWASQSDAIEFGIGWILVGSGTLTAVPVLSIVGVIWLVRRAAQCRGTAKRNPSSR